MEEVLPLKGKGRWGRRGAAGEVDTYHEWPLALDHKYAAVQSQCVCTDAVICTVS